MEPGFAVGHYNIGLLLQQQGQDSESPGYLLAAMELDPEYCLPLVTLGDIAMNSADFESAIGNYSAAYRLSPKHNRVKEVPRSLAKLGMQMARGGEYKNAAAFLEIAYELKPPKVREIMDFSFKMMNLYEQ